MFVSFDQMPDSSRVWIYQSNRQLLAADLAVIEEKGSLFFDQWAAHGQSLKSSFQVLHDRFLIVAVDESFHQASGCSIDSSVALVRDLQQTLNIDFFDRTKVCFLKDDQIFQSSMAEIKQHLQEGKVDSTSITFNNLVPNVAALKADWKISMETSWLKRYL